MLKIIKKYEMLNKKNKKVKEIKIIFKEDLNGNINYFYNNINCDELLYILDNNYNNILYWHDTRRQVENKKYEFNLIFYNKEFI